MTWWFAGTAVASLVVGQQANRKALSKAGDADREAIARNDVAAAGASKKLGTIVNRTQPGVDYMGSILAQDPNRLTPAQRINKEDAIRRQKQTMAGSGYGARTVVAGIDDLGKRYDAGAIAENTARSDRAAGVLDTENVNAITGQANIETGNAAQNSGIVQSGGVNAANVTTGNANMQGQTLAAIGGIFADQAKQKQVEARYAKYKEVPV